jgi:hypothetical protein
MAIPFVVSGGGSWLGDLGVWGFEGREGEGCI